MADLTIPNADFVGGTLIKSAEVDANNSAISTYINARNQGTTAWDGFSLDEIGAAPTAVTGALRLYSLSTDSGKLYTRDPSGNDFVMPGVIQIVQGTSTTAFSTTSTSYVATNTTVTITPKFDNSKVLVYAAGPMFNSATATTVPFATIAKGGTNLAGADGLARLDGSGLTDITAPTSMMYFDSPATTAATTYDVRIKSSSGSSVSWGVGTATQVIIAVEIAQL